MTERSATEKGLAVGFVGLGLMGKPMARNLMRAGHQLTVFNRTPEKAADLAAEGAILARDLTEMGSGCEIVFTMLPSSAAVERTLTGVGGLIESLRAGSLVIDTSTISPLVTRRMNTALAERGVGLLDAPVSGGDVGAVQGTLSIMVGGSATDFERAGPLLAALGRTIVHMGESGAGQLTKAANQIVVGLMIGAVGEAIVLARRGGVEVEQVLDVLGGGLAANRVIEVKREKYLDRRFMPGGRAELHLKDLGIALEVARDLGVVLPHTALLAQLFQAMQRKGWGDLDHSGLIRVFEELSGAGIGEEPGVEP
jgi:2-hydroxy-3-oxopropionate reductase